MKHLKKIAPHILTVVVLSVIACASAHATTYYIDYPNGSDSNNGTSKATPWKHQPYMQGWTGSYTHKAGDRFIFKGGVTWPHDCFQMTIRAGGSSTVYDYYGVDKTWYSGSFWSRPVFNGDLTTLASGPNSSIIDLFETKYVTIDNIEITGLLINSNAWAVASILNQSSNFVTIKDCYVHNWNVGPGVTHDGGRGGIIGAFWSPFTNDHFIVNSCTITNVDNTTKMNGVATEGVGTVENTVIHDVPTAALFDSNVHNCVFYNINYPIPSFDPSYHTNLAWISPGDGVSVVYDNIFHDSQAGAQLFLVPCWDNTSGTIYAFNNVMYNIGGGGGGDILADSSGGSAGCGAVYVYNNTLQSTGPLIRYLVRAAGSSYIGTMVVENNHLITDATSPFNFGSGGITPTTADNITQSNASAFSQSYTPGNGYAPVSRSCSTVRAGVSLISVGLPALDSDIRGNPRPSAVGSKWDAGAYQYKIFGLRPPRGFHIVN